LDRPERMRRSHKAKPAQPRVTSSLFILLS
jgi:hypothetical protein